MPLTSLTKLQGTSFGNVTATSITSNTVTVSNTTTSQVYAVSLTAGETLAALDAVYLEPTLTQGTAGRVYKMDADVLIKSTQAMFVGFALAAASAAANVNIQISGVVSGFTGLTTGSAGTTGSPVPASTGVLSVTVVSPPPGAGCSGGAAPRIIADGVLRSLVAVVFLVCLVAALAA